jgi:membrane associated rhomboid family serine protease
MIRQDLHLLLLSMHHTNGQPPVPDRTEPEEEHPAVTGGSPEHLALCSLILSAVGISHAHDRRRHVLRVAAADWDRARYQLESYFEENRSWPPRPPPAQPLRLSGNQPTFLMMGGLALFFLVTGPWQGQSDWFVRGAMDSEAVLRQREWWRLATALTLHADLVHLAGNCLIGGFLVHLLNRTVGYGMASLLLVSCGSMGNLLNIITRDQVHRSVGFSTAVFAAVGLFSGLQMVSGPSFRLRNILLSLGAGGGLLAMLGTSGERTDLGAHFFGFVCGLAAGIIGGRLRMLRLADHPRLQLNLLLLTMLFIIGSWMAAFGH